MLSIVNRWLTSGCSRIAGRGRLGFRRRAVCHNRRACDTRPASQDLSIDEVVTMQPSRSGPLPGQLLPVRGRRSCLLELPGQSFDDLGMFRRDVPGLADVLLHVEQQWLVVGLRGLALSRLRIARPPAGREMDLVIAVPLPLFTPPHSDVVVGRRISRS